MSIKETNVKQNSTFKPGKTPYCEFEGSMLNANVAWDELVSELLEHGASEQAIADYAECDLSVIREVQKQNYEGLWFRNGARIITMHSQYYPENYRA